MWQKSAGGNARQSLLVACPVSIVGQANHDAAMATEAVRFLVLWLAGRVNACELEVIDLLQEENRVLREQLGGAAAALHRRPAATPGRRGPDRRSSQARRFHRPGHPRHDPALLVNGRASGSHRGPPIGSQLSTGRVTGTGASSGTPSSVGRSASTPAAALRITQSCERIAPLVQ